MSPSVNLPVTLTANTNENVNDLNANLNALTGALNGGLDETNIPNLAAAFTTWKPLVVSGSLPGSGIVTAAGTWLMAPGWGNPLPVGGATSGSYAFDFDPADYVANTRTTKLRIRWEFTTGAVAPAMTVTAGLYPVTAYSAASGVQMSVSAVGAVVAGSTVAFASQAASTTAQTLSSEFNAPAAGAYVLGFAASAGMAAGAQATLRANLQARQV